MQKAVASVVVSPMDVDAVTSILASEEYRVLYAVNCFRCRDPAGAPIDGAVENVNRPKVGIWLVKYRISWNAEAGTPGVLYLSELRLHAS